jgi:hypothetical protein
MVGRQLVFCEQQFHGGRSVRLGVHTMLFADKRSRTAGVDNAIVILYGWM